MHRRFINNAVLIGKGQLALMPLLHKHEKQRRQQSRGLGAYAAAVALNQRRLDLGGNFRETVRRYTLMAFAIGSSFGGFAGGGHHDRRGRVSENGIDSIIRQRDRAQGMVYAPGTTAGTGIAVVVGAAAWAGFALWAHAWLIGVAPMGR